MYYLNLNAEATETPTETPTDTPTETPLPTDTPTETPLPTDTPTEAPTETPLPTDTPTETPLPTDTPTETPTGTITGTPTVTPTVTETATTTSTPTVTPTATVTATPPPPPSVVPIITGGNVAGSGTVSGTSDPDPTCGTDCKGVEIFQCTAGKCSLVSATQIGGCKSIGLDCACPDSSGKFTVTLTSPLVCGDLVFGYDDCTKLTGPVYQVPCGPSPVPAMSSGMIAALVGTLGLIGLFGLLRLRRGL